MANHPVVILGGGFGGLHAAQALKSASVDATLIDRRNYHLFQPLLYQVATGSLSPGEIAAPLRGVLNRQKNTRVLLGEAVDIDPVAKRIILRDGASIKYDSMIAATGSESNYFGNDSWRKWAPSLKSVEEATAIRHKILYAFEAAERVCDPEERLAWLIWLFVHLMYLVEFQSRILVFIQWGFQYLTFSRGARLITGSAASDYSQEVKLPQDQRG